MDTDPAINPNLGNTLTFAFNFYAGNGTSNPPSLLNTTFLPFSADFHISFENNSTDSFTFNTTSQEWELTSSLEVSFAFSSNVYEISINRNAFLRNQIRIFGVSSDFALFSPGRNVGNNFSYYTFPLIDKVTVNRDIHVDSFVTSSKYNGSYEDQTIWEGDISPDTNSVVYIPTEITITTQVLTCSC